MRTRGPADARSRTAGTTGAGPACRGDHATRVPSSAWLRPDRARPPPWWHASRGAWHCGVDPASICALTFNRRAAEELQERTDRALGELGLATGERARAHLPCPGAGHPRGCWRGCHPARGAPRAAGGAGRRPPAGRRAALARRRLHPPEAGPRARAAAGGCRHSRGLRRVPGRAGCPGRPGPGRPAWPGRSRR